MQELARERWEAIRDGYVVPSADLLSFGNTSVPLDATVLYADIPASTEMVDALPDTRAAEYYKALLHCAATVVKAEGGTITAYDGDRLMAIFVGETQATDAIRAALKISGTIVDVINPQFLAYIGTVNKNCSPTLLESLAA